MVTSRAYFLLLLLACIGLLGFGLYLEHGVGLEPCPLCILQRLAYVLIALVALIAVIHGPRQFAGKIYHGVISVIALAGAAIAGRQIWLQHLPPDEVPECGPGLEYMLEVFPLREAIGMVFTGSGECAEVQWRFMSMSIAEWSMICFLAILIASVPAILYRHSFKPD